MNCHEKAWNYDEIDSTRGMNKIRTPGGDKFRNFFAFLVPLRIVTNILVY